MKFEDVTVGMHLRDPKGNVWKIIDISAGKMYPVSMHDVLILYIL